MSASLVIYLIIAVAVLLVIAYAIAIYVRKRNESKLAILEEKKEELYNLPVNDEVEAVKNMHLIGQSQVTFREWNQKWVDLSLNSFADIENNLFEAEGYNHSFRFLKASHQIDQIESQITLIEEDIAEIRNALADLEKQESKNSGRVLHALDLFEELQHRVAENSEQYGQALDEIEKQSDFHFFYNNKQVNTSRIVSIKSKQKNVFNVLEQLFSGTNISYKVLDKSIILSPKEVLVAQQKSRKITGVVTDGKGEPVPGANVIQRGTTNGTISDIDGKFSLEVPDNATLVISFIGYVTKNIAVGHKEIFNITLLEDSRKLDEVVVTALGIKREEKALGYAVQKVKGDNLPLAKTVDVTTSLTGKVAGLNIQNSTEFNETPKIKLRGETPLIIVDGVPYGNITLDEIASDDIESIDVLKGATASALYGARGTSGAIMITTKKGANEEGLNININSNTMFFSGYLAFPETQHSYSRGFGGKYNNDYVWGDKLDIGRTAILWDPFNYE